MHNSGIIMEKEEKLLEKGKTEEGGNPEFQNRKSFYHV